MCIIICLNPIEKMKTEISQDWLKQSWENNTDGAGFSFINQDENKKNNLITMKGFFDYKKFNEAFIRNRELNPKSLFLIHMRNTTYGCTDVNNCHPHTINKYCVMAHNGSIGRMNAKTKEGPSDSALFAEFLSKLNNNFYQNEEYLYMIEKYVGISNKIAFMGINNSIYFINMDKWIAECDRNVLMSNDYYKTKRKTYAQAWEDGDEYVPQTYGSYYAFYKGVCSKCNEEKMVQKRSDVNDLPLCSECYITADITVKDVCNCCKKVKSDVHYSTYKNGTVKISEHLCLECYNKKTDKISRIGGVPDTIKQDDTERSPNAEVCYECGQMLIGKEYLNGYCSECYDRHCNCI